jgi:trk system potassium uptake protein TrkA
MLRSLDIITYDVCFVCISSDFQASLEITAQLKELGAKYIVSKTDRDVHTKFLRCNGADDVVYIDRDIAQKTAVKFSAKNAFNYIELEQDYAISDMVVPESWAGRSLKVLELATKYQINVIGVRSGEKVIPVTDPDYVLQEREHIVVAGLKKDILSLIDK